ncbi:MAG TPA: EamA family transporter [Candidatus Babeliales bacterium]|nr:EamA family transporter [Candidatus Babeliales bacterium]
MRLHHVAIAVLITAIWGMNFVVIHLGLKEVSPQILCCIRFFLASFPMILFVKRPSVPFKEIAIYSFVMFILQFTFLFTGMKVGMTAGVASLLMQTQIFFTVFLAFSVLGEKLNRWQIIGALISFSGIILVGKNLGNSVSLLGFILTIAAAGSWGMGNLISKRIGKVNMFSLVIWGSFIAWPPLLLVSIVFDGPDKFIYSLEHLSWLSVFSIAYIVYPTTLFGFAAWSWLLSKYPASMVAPFTLLVPIFGVLSSAIFLDEPLQPWKLIAAALVISGLCINLLIPRLVVRLSVANEAVT